MQRATVVLPEPDSPTRPSVSPRRTSRLTRSAARTSRLWNHPPRYTLVRSTVRSTTSGAAARARCFGARPGTEPINMRV
jgi:hypothetical protein